MKKLAILVLILLCVVNFNTVSSASVDNTFEVMIIKVVGDVQVAAKGDGTWKTAVTGTKLKTGAAIKTGGASRIDIVYDAPRSNLVRIGENTRITISKSSLELLEGSVFAKFANLKGGSTFTVRTPNATCGIRGSGLEVNHIKGMTVVSAFEGKVFVQGLDAAGKVVGKEVIIPDGWKALIGAGGAVEQPEELTPNEKRIWDAWVGVATGKVPPGEVPEEPEEPEKPIGSNYRR